MKTKKYNIIPRIQLFKISPQNNSLLDAPATHPNKLYNRWSEPPPRNKRPYTRSSHQRICIFCNCRTTYEFSGDYCRSCNTEYYGNHGNMFMPGDCPTASNPYFQFNLIPGSPHSAFIVNGYATIRFDHMPNITPQNIVQKYKTYILFS